MGACASRRRRQRLDVDEFTSRQYVQVRPVELSRADDLLYRLSVDEDLWATDDAAQVAVIVLWPDDGRDGVLSQALSRQPGHASCRILRRDLAGNGLYISIFYPRDLLRLFPTLLCRSRRLFSRKAQSRADRANVAVDLAHCLLPAGSFAGGEIFWR